MGRKDLAEWKIRVTFASGKMAEWSIAAVLKTVELRGSGGSNPSLSAIGGGSRIILAERSSAFFVGIGFGKTILLRTIHYWQGYP